MYYLQSRYYDPNTGRFLNADSFVSTGQGLLGNNMFAYCNNNPASCYDPSGAAAISVCNGDRNPLFIGYWGLGGGGASGSLGGGVGNGLKSSRQKAQDIVLREVNYLLNSDEQTVLDAQYIAFYKGIIVIKAPIEDAFSFGIIVMETGATSKNLVRHEYGHLVHLKQIGLPAYLLTAFIPSVIGYWSGVDYDDYYSQPWEFVADYFGGVNNRLASNKQPYAYAEWAPGAAACYWLITMIVGGV